MTEHTKIDLDQLAREIRAMNPRKQIFKVLKRELKRVDHWKDQGKWFPPKGHKTVKKLKGVDDNEI